jgi:beta-alanine degradation protein BauB
VSFIAMILPVRIWPSRLWGSSVSIGTEFFDALRYLDCRRLIRRVTQLNRSELLMFVHPRLLALAAGMLAAFAAAAAETSVSVPVTDLKFTEAGIGPLKVAPGYGDLGKGAHGTFVKFPAGFVSPLHAHSDDYSGVVISGVLANEASASVKERPLAPGSYWFQRGKANHVTKCLSANECVFFITQPGKFDFIEAH